MSSGFNILIRIKLFGKVDSLLNNADVFWHLSPLIISYISSSMLFQVFLRRTEPSSNNKNTKQNDSGSCFHIILLNLDVVLKSI